MEKGTRKPLAEDTIHTTLVKFTNLTSILSSSKKSKISSQRNFFLLEKVRPV